MGKRFLTRMNASAKWWLAPNGMERWRACGASSCVPCELFDLGLVRRWATGGKVTRCVRRFMSTQVNVGLPGSPLMICRVVARACGGRSAE